MKKSFCVFFEIYQKFSSFALKKFFCVKKHLFCVLVLIFCVQKQLSQ